MSKNDPVVVFVGIYPSDAAARADYDVVKDLHVAIQQAAEELGTA